MRIGQDTGPKVERGQAEGDDDDDDENEEALSIVDSKGIKRCLLDTKLE